MSDLESLVASYLDLPHDGADEPSFVPGVEEQAEAWAKAQLAALRSIAHAAEDLELDALADEIDRTMLLDTIRLDMHRLRHAQESPDVLDEAEAWLAALGDRPLGLRGTLRQLTARREEVAQQVAAVAALLGASAGIEAVQMLRDETRDDGWVVADGWQEEWQRTAEHLRVLGFPVVAGDAPPLPDAAGDEWSFATLALRAQAIRTFEQTRQAQSRPARQRLLAPGLLAGWGRTVCTVCADTVLFDLPERRLMLWWRSLQDAVAAELDLEYLAGLLTEEQVGQAAAARLGEAEAPAVVRRVLGSGGEALAAALAHEQWLDWWREATLGGTTDAAWLQEALAGGGLSVRLAQWSRAVEAHSAE